MSAYDVTVIHEPDIETDQSAIASYFMRLLVLYCIALHCIALYCIVL